MLPESARHKGQHRSARIVQVWTPKGAEPNEETSVALLVDLDPLNDPPTRHGPLFMSVDNCAQDPHGKMPGSWHEPERVDSPALREARSADRAKREAREGRQAETANA